MSAGATARSSRRSTSRRSSEVKHLVPFHHDPGHTDADLDRLMDEAMAEAAARYRVTPAREGATFEI